MSKKEANNESLTENRISWTLRSGDIINYKKGRNRMDNLWFFDLYFGLKEIIRYIVEE